MSVHGPLPRIKSEYVGLQLFAAHERDRLLTRNEDVDFDENTSSVFGVNTSSARLESGASSRRGCASHGYIIS